MRAILTGASAALLVGCAPGEQRPTQELITGYALNSGDMILIFPSREALQNFDYAACRNAVGPGHLSKPVRDGQRIIARVEVFEGVFDGTEDALYVQVRLNGRRLQHWCSNPSVYWMRNVKIGG